jgi:hypothetical protein
VTNGLGLMIEGLVAVLLLLTIGYCWLLNTRLKRLKADEATLKATIAELISATEMAERAIAGLKLTVRECDENLGDRLRTAERFSADMDRQIVAGQSVLDKLVKIVAAARPAPQPVSSETVAVPEANAILASAEAFVARSRARIQGVAA